MRIKFFLGTLAFCIIVIILHFSISGMGINPNNQGFWFNIAVLFLLLTISGFIICFLARSRDWKTISLMGILLFGSFAVRVLFSDFQSEDYNIYLSHWVEEYRNLSIADSLKSDISNYLPIYNYFLIFFSRIPIYDLYLIKLLSCVFEILSAFAIVLIVSRLTKKQVNPVFFALILLIPIFFIDSSVWAQCDAIYTFFGLLGFYFAISRKSFLAFLFFGISFAIKLQSILIFPMVIILLFMKTKDGNRFLDPRFIPIALVPFFALNFWGILVGVNPINVFSIYFGQISSTMSVFSHFANLPYFFNDLFAPSTRWLYYVGIITFVLLTAIWLLGVIWVAIKKARKNELSSKDLLFLTYYILLGTMFFMPKMHERFIYFTLLIGIIYLAIILDEKSFRLHLLAYLGIILSTTIMFVSYLFSTVNYLFEIYFNAFTFGAFIMLAVFIYFSHVFYKEYLQNTSKKQDQKVNL